jgi:multiple sugar transport system substrate-binding protein
MQWCGLWAMPGIRKEIQDDFYVIAWPKLDDQGSPSTFLGGWTTFVAAKGKNVDEARAFAKWLWIDNAKNQQDWSLSYGFHIPPRKSSAAGAEKLKSGAAKEVWDIVNQYGHDEAPYWTGAMGTLWTTCYTNIIKNGADPKKELDTAAQKCQEELDKILA